MSALIDMRDTPAAVTRPRLDHKRRLSATREAMASALAQHFRTRVRAGMTPGDIRRALEVFVTELQSSDAPSEVIDAVSDTLQAQFVDDSAPPAQARGPRPASFTERLADERQGAAKIGRSR